eukprot:TRINITY_DN11639_c0_g1_i1.p1 TRINITY_DN11639_c0_g1~~TRINITY_DN11639_c0_g1_i1.p1  ORF type:complete len:136 (+),score=12.80 TRINITY_DN11639_c0_g1_i1:81-488(+)
MELDMVDTSHPLKRKASASFAEESQSKKGKIESSIQNENRVPNASNATSMSDKATARANEDLLEKYTGTGSSVATRRLIHDLKKVIAIDPGLGIKAIPIGDNLYHWSVEFYQFEEGSGLAADLLAAKKAFGHHLT